MKNKKTYFHGCSPVQGGALAWAQFWSTANRIQFVPKKIVRVKSFFWLNNWTIYYKNLSKNNINTSWSPDQRYTYRVLQTIALFFHRLFLISFFGRDDALLFVLVPRPPHGAHRTAPPAGARGTHAAWPT
jgi:hypothetical protein